MRPHSNRHNLRTSAPLFGLGLEGVDDSAAFAEGEDLVGLDPGKPLDLLRRGPFDFDEIHRLEFAQTEVEP